MSGVVSRNQTFTPGTHFFTHETRHTASLRNAQQNVCTYVGPDWLRAPVQRQSTLSGCLHPASTQMFCGLLCKPTCICLLAFQNVWYRCIHYGLSSWPPTQHVLCSRMAGILFLKGRRRSLLKGKTNISCVFTASLLRVYICMVYSAFERREIHVQLLDTNGKCIRRRQTLEC